METFPASDLRHKAEEARQSQSPRRSDVPLRQGADDGPGQALRSDGAYGPIRRRRSQPLFPGASIAMLCLALPAW